MFTLLLACADLTPADCVEAVWFEDGDGDGFGDVADPGTRACESPGLVPTATDCDDADATVHPGASEICDPADRDEDCDGRAEDDDSDVEGAVPYAPDIDGDGFGDDSLAVTSCEPGDTTWTSTLGDCDDTRADISPAGLEACDADNVDEDCNGLADADDPDATGLFDDLFDGDGDGYGDGSVQRCPEDSVDVIFGGDCDDTAPDIHPDAADCEPDGVDQDCSGRPDDGNCHLLFDGDRDLGDAEASVLGAVANRGFGTSVALSPDLTGDGLDDLVVGSQDPDFAVVSNGDLSVLSGPILGEIDASDQSFLRLNGAAGEAFGSQVFALGDADADGAADLAAHAATTSHLVRFDAPLGGDFQASAVATATYNDPESGCLGFGSLAAETDGDGVAELWVADPCFALDFSVKGGLLHAFDVSLDGNVGLDDAIVSFPGPGTSGAGHDLASGDANGDGLGDLLVGSFDYGDAGRAWLLIEPLVSAGFAGAQATLVGEAFADLFGWEVSLADMDGDALADLVVGVAAGSGALGWWPSNSSGDLSTEDAVLWVTGSLGTSFAGSLASGDFDADGFTDLAVDVGGKNPTLCLIFGPHVGTESDVDACDVLASDDDDAGFDLASGGDLDGDGWEDLAVGTPKAGANDDGSVILVFGAPKP